MTRPKDEQGAVAVIYALVAVLLVGMAALAVDIGNTVARRADTQAQADFAALAGATQIRAAMVPGTPPAAVVAEVRDYLNGNQPQDDGRACWRSTPVNCVTVAHLTDADMDNGDVRYTASGLRVTTPRAWVDFGFAEVFDISGTFVSGDATVNTYTGGRRVLPMYAFSGCDFGTQTIGSPPGGHLPTVGPPPLAMDADTNETTLTSGSQVLRDSTGAVVDELVLDSVANQLTLSAGRWTQTTKIGFFPETALAPFEQAVFNTGATVTGASAAPFTTSSGTVSLRIPDAVADGEGIWWVRVFNDSVDKWSAADQALPIRVGGAALECDGASSSGNFGLLDFPRTDVTPSLVSAMNVAVGLQAPLTPGLHTWAVDNASDGTCSHGLNGAVESDRVNLRPGTSCIGTDTGDLSQALTDGLITGLDRVSPARPGLLTAQGTRTGCDPDGGSANRSVDVHGSYSINNEVLTCYLTNGTTSLAIISSRSYAGPPVLHEDIYSSPRFVLVPVLKVQPARGASTRYSVVDFRPGFITDERASPLAVKGSFTGTPQNGVIVERDKIEQLKVVFIDHDALPRDGDFPVMAFLGAGRPVVRLVD